MTHAACVLTNMLIISDHVYSQSKVQDPIPSEYPLSANIYLCATLQKLISTMVNQKDTRPRSFKRNKAKRATQFKKGVGPPKKAICLELPENPGTSTEVVDCQPAVQNRIIRLSGLEASDVQAVATSASSELLSADVLQYKLRPKPEMEELPEDSNLDENVIVNLQKMEELISHMHSQMCKKPNVSVNIEKRVGLCISMSLECRYCHYKSPGVRMTDTIKKARGPGAGALHDMLAVSVLKSKVGVHDVLNVLACMNIKVPSAKTVQKKVNSLSNTSIHVNTDKMIQNQDYVRHIASEAGVESEVDAQFDVSFSCRPQGGSEKAGQTYGVLIEHSTTQNLPLAVATANKHCKKKGCSHENCSKNFPNESSIASSERVLIHDTMGNIGEASLVKLRSITTDSSTQVAKAIRDFQHTATNRAIHYKCFVHRLRTLDKHIRQLTLKSIPKTYNKAGYMQKFAGSVRARARLELTNLNARRLSEANFIQSGAAAVGNILQCFSGKHRLCRQVSTVCISHLQHFSTASLPYGVNVELNQCDLDLVQTKVSTIFDNQGLREVSKLYNTNMCESMHAAVYNYAPKSSCWTRNFAGKCHSATHSRTLGPGKSTIKIAIAAGINVKKNSQFYVAMMARDKMRQYHSRRKRTSAYKQARYFQRKRRSNKTLFQNSLYTTDNTASCSASEHSYGLTN